MKRSKSSSHRPKPPTPIPVARKLIYSACIVIVVFGLPELGLRLFWTPSPPSEPVVGTRKFVNWLSELSLGQDRTEQLYDVDRERLWALVPNSHIQGINGHFNPHGGETQEIHIHVNADGYRGPLYQPTAEPSTFRVLCMGDSNFFGYPLDDADVFPTVLAGALSRKFADIQVEVINGGIPGYSVVQGKIFYEQQFEQYDFDWLLLSYLNNDALPQPHADRDLLEQQKYVPQFVTKNAQNIQLVRWAQSLTAREVPENEFVPRTSLDDFVQHYRVIIESAHQKTAQVLILDYCAYEKFEPYSRALAELAKELDVRYFLVRQHLRGAIQNRAEREKYPEQAARVRRRWGTLLDKRPLLWFCAEYYPEHLNEIGTAWLADRIADMMVQTQ